MDLTLSDKEELETISEYLKGKINDLGKRKKTTEDAPKQLAQMQNTILRLIAINFPNKEPEELKIEVGKTYVQLVGTTEFYYKVIRCQGTWRGKFYYLVVNIETGFQFQIDGSTFVREYFPK